MSSVGAKLGCAFTAHSQAGDLAVKVFLQELLPGETKQAASGDRGLACPHHSPGPASPAAAQSRHHKHESTSTVCLLVRVEPTRLIRNLLMVENRPSVLAIYWAGDKAVTGYPVPSAPHGGKKSETVSQPHLREISTEFLAASFTSVAVNATGSP